MSVYKVVFLFYKSSFIEIVTFFDFALLQGVNWAQSWTKNANSEDVLLSQKFEFFEKRHVAVGYL